MRCTADHAQRIEYQRLDVAQHRCGKDVVGPACDGVAQRAAVAVGQRKGFRGEYFFDIGLCHRVTLRRNCIERYHKNLSNGLPCYS